MQSPRSILITGASSGLGAEMAKQYARAGVTLFLMGRNGIGLSKTHNICREKGALVQSAQIDVCDETAMRKQILKWDDYCPIDLVIANAGMGYKGQEDMQMIKTVFDTNFYGTMHTVDPMIARMKKRKKGQIAFMSSLAAYRGMPGSQTYSASKAAVRFMGEALRPDLARNNIQVNVICPGFVRTPLTDQNEFKMPFRMEPAPAAKKIIAGLAKNKARIAFPWIMYAFVRLLEILPNNLTDKMLLDPPERDKNADKKPKKKSTEKKKAPKSMKEAMKQAQSQKKAVK